MCDTVQCCRFLTSTHPPTNTPTSQHARVHSVRERQLPTKLVSCCGTPVGWLVGWSVGQLFVLPEPLICLSALRTLARNKYILTCTRVHVHVHDHVESGERGVRSGDGEWRCRRRVESGERRVESGNVEESESEGERLRLKSTYIVRVRNLSLLTLLSKNEWVGGRKEGRRKEKKRKAIRQCHACI